MEIGKVADHVPVLMAERAERELERHLGDLIVVGELAGSKFAWAPAADRRACPGFPKPPRPSGFWIGVFCPLSATEGGQNCSQAHVSFKQR